MPADSKCLQIANACTFKTPIFITPVLIVSHFTFSHILENKCNEFGKKLYYVDESYTSKTCGSCGSIYDVKLSRVYSCNMCLQQYDRDMNAARNILIKNE